MIVAWPAVIDYWHWWIFACALLVLELLLPGVFFLWLAMAAAVVGGLLLLMPGLGFAWQLFLFTTLSLITVLAWRYYLLKHPLHSDEPYLNQRGKQYVGRVFTVTEAISNGYGRIKIDDSTWRAKGPDCPIGSRVRVLAMEDMCLHVELEHLPDL